MMHIGVPELITIGIGMFVLLFAWWADWATQLFGSPPKKKQRRPADEAISALSGFGTERVAGAPGGPAIPKPDKAELEQQRMRRVDVKRRSIDAARRIKSLHAAASLAQIDGDTAALTEALKELHAIVDENEDDGPIGVVASTELCNALLNEDVLKVLEALQSHTDADIRAHSSAVFNHVVPRIWSF